MSDCVFCKIAANEIPAVKVYENSEFLAFLDIRPVRPGHTLVISKAHYDRFDSAPPEAAGKLWQVVQKVATAVVRATHAQGYNATINNGRAAGQVVDHVHMHVIPRAAKDGLSLWAQGEYQGGEDEQVAQAIRQALKT